MDQQETLFSLLGTSTIARALLRVDRMFRPYIEKDKYILLLRILNLLHIHIFLIHFHVKLFR
jgi:hypothetical protein